MFLCLVIGRPLTEKNMEIVTGKLLRRGGGVKRKMSNFDYSDDDDVQ